MRNDIISVDNDQEFRNGIFFTLKGIVLVFSVIILIIVNVLVYYGYYHYLQFSARDAIIALGCIGAPVTYLFCEKQNVFKKVFYILLLMAVSGYTGIAMVHVGIIT